MNDSKTAFKQKVFFFGKGCTWEIEEPVVYSYQIEYMLCNETIKFLQAGEDRGGGVYDTIKGIRI